MANGTKAFALAAFMALAAISGSQGQASSEIDPGTLGISSAPD